MEREPKKHLIIKSNKPNNTKDFINLTMPQQQKLLKTLQSIGIEEYYNDNKGKCLWGILRILLIINLRNSVGKYYKNECEGHNLQIRILTENVKRILRDIRNGNYYIITELEPDFIPQFCELCNKKNKDYNYSICSRHYCFNCNGDYTNLKYSPEHYLSLAVLECYICGYNEQL